MSVFSDLLSAYINEKQIKILSLAKYCDIDRSTMYKVMNGKRNPPSQETLKKMAHFMHLTPVEHQKFQEAWKITRIGEELYYKRKSVENFICHFPDLPATGADLQFFMMDDTDFYTETDCTVLSSRMHINHCLYQIFLKETARTNGKIALFLQPDYDFLFQLLATMPATENLTIDHLLCLTTTDEFTDKNELVNLKYLHTMFPLYMAGLDYHTWYFYDKIHSHYHNFNLFPCMILTSDAAITCTADYQNGILYTSPDVLNMLWQMFHTYQGQCNPFFTTTAFTPDNYIEVFDHMFDLNYEESALTGIQPEACITPFLTGDFLDRIFNHDLSSGEEILKQANIYFGKNMKKLTAGQFHIYFTANGMLHFAQSGRTEEIPDIFYRTLTPLERIHVLRQVAECCKSGTYRILQKPLNMLPRNLHLCISGNTGTMIFRSNAGRSSVLTIQEYSLVNTIQDYLENMDEESAFYSTTDAVAYIQQLIYMLEQM